MRTPRFLSRINTAFMVLAAFWTLLLAASITIDVFCRTAFDSPVLGTTELITNSVVMIAFMQLPYAVFSESMLRADFLLHAMSKGLARGFAIAGACLGAGLFGLLAYGTVGQIATTFESGEFVGEGVVRIPVWPIYTVIVLGSALATINYLVNIAMLVRGEGDV